MLIGTAGFNVWSRTHQRGELSYDLARPHWGKGLMTRVVQTICDYGFSAMGINRIQATVAIDNIASIRVLSKVGFQEEGLMRDYGILHGKKKDFYMMSYLRKDITF
jgi:ribosomal-protein-alanine N-acetyltransferase